MAVINLDEWKRKKKTPSTKNKPSDKRFIAICTKSNCGWSRTVTIPAEQNTPEGMEVVRQGVKNRHDFEVRGCSGEITLVQDSRRTY